MNRLRATEHAPNLRAKNKPESYYTLAVHTEPVDKSQRELMKV
jgi:hypothetical protein